MRKMIIASILIAQALPSYAADMLKQYVPDAQQVGSGRFTMLLWDVYDASLYAPNGRFSSDQPFALTLHYLRDIEGADIADRSAEEIRKLGLKDEIRIAGWHSQMREIFPNVKAGTELTGVASASGTTIFYLNGKMIGDIRDPEFQRWFFDIWLADDTSAPELRAALLGLN